MMPVSQVPTTYATDSLIGDHAYSEDEVEKVYVNEYGIDFQPGTDFHDPAYPGLFEAETRHAAMDGPLSAMTEVDPVGEPVPPDYGGTAGHVLNNVATYTGGVQPIEEFALLGKVEDNIPQSRYFYEAYDGPVGTRSVGEEVGEAVYYDHMDVLSDPFAVREDLAGSI